MIAIVHNSINLRLGRLSPISCFLISFKQYTLFSKSPVSKNKPRPFHLLAAPNMGPVAKGFSVYQKAIPFPPILLLPEIEMENSASQSMLGLLMLDHKEPLEPPEPQLRLTKLL